MRLRPPRPHDAAAIAHLMNVYDVAHGGEAEMDAGEVHDEWSYPGFDRERDAWLFEGERGEVLAYGWVARRSADGHYGLDVHIHPVHRDAGVGMEIFRLMEERACELGATLFVTGILGADEWGGELLRELGYSYTRSQFRMAIDLAEAPSPAHVPEGIELRAFREGDEPTYHETITEAFAEEWGYESESFDDWRAHFVERESFDPKLWFLAVAGNQPAGALLAYPMGAGGWIRAIGVLPAWRKRGVGLALLQRSFAAFYEGGRTHVALAVDEANPTGAGRLYRAAGMRETHRIDRYDKAPTAS